jgi:hypothetical protein
MTVQALLEKLATRVDPVAKGTSATVAGQKFKASGDGITVSSIANNGSNLIRVTAAGHGLTTNTYVTIYGAAGAGAASLNNTASNPAWLVTVINSSTYDLVGSTFASATIGTPTMVATMVGSVEGARFTPQRLLDIYNEARVVLVQAVRETKTPKELDKLISSIFTSASITIAAVSGGYRTIAKPSGFIKLVKMTDSASTPVRINVLPSSLLEDVAESITSAYTSSASNLLAFEIGANWSIYGNFGTTPALVDYYGITDWVWVTHVMPNSTNEIFRTDLEPVLIEIACAIADEQSNTDPLALAKQLLNQGKQS